MNFDGKVALLLPKRLTRRMLRNELPTLSL